MKKIISLVLLTVLVTSLFTGCGPKKQTPQETGNTTPKTETGSEVKQPEETPKAAEKTLIKFAAQADSTPATKAVIEAFNSSQDKYTVEWVEFTNESGQMHDQLMTSLSSGSSEYDVLSLDVVWAGEFAGAGYLEAMDMRMKDDGLKKSDFNSGSMASGNYQGKQYTLPFFPDLGLLYYRSDIVSQEDAAKLISGNYTYLDLADMAAKYKGQGGTETGFVYQSKQYEGLTCNSTEFTASFTDVKAGLEAMKKFTDADFTPTDILNYTEGETHTNYSNGLSVFSRNWPYQYGVIKGDDTPLKEDQTGVAPLPNGGSVGGWLLSINKASKNVDGAWEFVKFVSGAEGQKIMSTQGGYLPGYNALLSDADVIKANPMLSFEGFKNALSTTIARPVSPEYSKVSDTIQINVHKYLSGSQDIDATVNAIAEAMK